LAIQLGERKSDPGYYKINIENNKTKKISERPIENMHSFLNKFTTTRTTTFIKNT